MKILLLVLVLVVLSACGNLENLNGLKGGELTSGLTVELPMGVGRVVSDADKEVSKQSFGISGAKVCIQEIEQENIELEKDKTSEDQSDCVFTDKQGYFKLPPSGSYKMITTEYGYESDSRVVDFATLGANILIIKLKLITNDNAMSSEVNKVHFDPMSKIGSIFAKINGKLVGSAKLDGKNAQLITLKGEYGTKVEWSNSFNNELMYTVLEGKGNYDGRGHYIIFKIKSTGLEAISTK